MPQFIQEITSISHSLLCSLKMNRQAKIAGSLEQRDDKQRLSQRVMMQQVLLDKWEPDNPGEEHMGRGDWSRAKISVLFKSMGLMQSHEKGKLVHTVSGVI